MAESDLLRCIFELKLPFWRLMPPSVTGANVRLEGLSCMQSCMHKVDLSTGEELYSTRAVRIIHLD
jgi:hypothetical protein